MPELPMSGLPASAPTPDPLDLRARLRAGPVLNGWLQLPGGMSAELLGRAGYAALTVDLQHGLIGDGGLVPALQAVRAAGAAPLVRVPWLHPPDLMRALDAGAQGVICPMIDTAEQARSLVDACLYPPQGRRSSGPTRARLLYGDDYAARANGEVLILAMVETRAALRNLEAILDVPGLGGVFVGPADLSLDLYGEATLDFRAGELAAHVARIARETLRRGLIPGIFTPGAELARAALGLGYTLVTAGSDTLLLGGAAQALMAQLRAEPPPAPDPVVQGPVAADPVDADR